VNGKLKAEKGAKRGKEVAKYIYEDGLEIKVETGMNYCTFLLLRFPYILE
jgi:hypothetical protein